MESISRVSAFASRLSPLNDRQKQAYSYLFDQNHSNSSSSSSTVSSLCVKKKPSYTPEENQRSQEKLKQLSRLQSNEERSVSLMETDENLGKNVKLAPPLHSISGSFVRTSPENPELTSKTANMSFTSSTVASGSRRVKSKGRRRNSVIGGSGSGSGSGNGVGHNWSTSSTVSSTSVCKELVDLDLHCSHESMANTFSSRERGLRISNASPFAPIREGTRARVESEVIPRPGNPLATLFNRQQSRTPEPLIMRS